MQFVHVVTVLDLWQLSYQVVDNTISENKLYCDPYHGCPIGIFQQGCHCDPEAAYMMLLPSSRSIVVNKIFRVYIS